MSIERAIALTTLEIETLKPVLKKKNPRPLVERGYSHGAWVASNGVFGKLKVIGGVYYKEKDKVLWPMALCRCSCGHQKSYGCLKLLSGRLKMCGNCRRKS